MSREIKFRVWDKENKTMLVYPIYELDGEGLKDDIYSELMQYTGINDKNGKEIYEGDILYTKLTDKMGNKAGGTYLTVEFANYPAITGFNVNLRTTNNREIVGNIYENPELLEDK